MPHEQYAYTAPRPLSTTDKLRLRDEAIERARLQGAEIITDEDGTIWARTEGFPGTFVKRRMS